MNIVDSLGRGIDRTIGLFSPQSEVLRSQARHQLQINRKQYRSKNSTDRQYAAAKTNRMTGDWTPVNQDINTLIRTSSATIRARTRQLVRDCPYFKRAVEVLVDHTIGTGIKFQSRVKFASGQDQGKFDKTSNRKIEDFIKWWMDEASVDGKLHFHELEQLAKRQNTESGEYLFVKKILKKKQAKGRLIPFALQPMETDWLTTISTQADKNNFIDQGVEYDRATGQIIAYHFQIPDGFNSQLTGSTSMFRIPAEDVIHGFETLRPGQLRGISPFTTAIMGAHDLSDYLDTEMDAAKMAAKWVAFVTSDDPANIQSQNAVDGTGADEGKKIEEMENGLIEYLRRNESVTLADHNRPGDSFAPFVQFELRMASVATGTTYELLTNDYQKINYSTSKVIRNDFKKRIAPQVLRQINHFSRPAINSAMDVAVMADELDLPGYFQNPRHYQQGAFIGPGMDQLDPLREGKANETAIAAGLKSPQEIAMERGRDYEEVLDEIAIAKKMTEDRELVWMPNIKGAGGLQQNPDKLGASANAQK